MLDRLESVLERARSEGRTALVPYVTIGFPSLEDTLAIVPAIERLVHAYLGLRSGGSESFLQTYRRLGLGPFKAALYPERADANAA